MKKILLLVGLLWIGLFGYGQTTIATQGFEASGETWTISSGSSNISTSNGSSDLPESERIRTGSKSWQVNDSDDSFELNSYNTTGFTTLKVIFYVSSTALTSGNGSDGTDFVKAYIATDGGAYPSSPDITINGNTNAKWGFGPYVANSNNYTSSGIASGAAGTAVSYAPSAGGYREADAYHKVEISISGTPGTVALKVECKNNSGNEIWSIDDIVLEGVIAGPDNPDSFSATTNSTSQIDLAFTVNGDGDNVVIVYDSDGTFSTPSGAPPAIGNTFAGGTLLYNGTSSPNNHTSLSSGTQYFYKAWSYDGSDYSTGLTDDATTLSPEPTKHITSFTATANGANVINLSWTDDTGGAQDSHGVLILANTSGTFTDPADGTAQSNDTDLSDGSGVYNSNRGVEAYSWTGLSSVTQYFFKTFTFTNSGSHINYKTDGTPPTDNATTEISTAPKLFISEVADPSDEYEARFVELYNAGSFTINFATNTWYLAKQSNGGSWLDVQLTGSCDAGDKYVIGNNTDNFNSFYGFNPDLTHGTLINGNGDDGYFLFKDGDHSTGTLIDIFGVEDEDGSGEIWEYEDTKAVRKRSVTEANTIWAASEWNIPSSAAVEDMTPAEHNEDVTWQGTTDTDWNSKGDNWSGTNHYIPDVSFNVIIPNTANKPIISAESSCFSLTVNSGAILTVSGGKSLNVFGTLTNNAGTTGLVLQSNSTSPSSLIHNTNSVSATVESYFEDLDKWYLVSPPITDATAAVFIDQYLDYWDESIALWVDITEPSTGINSGQGYSAKKTNDNGDGNTATYSGNLNNGSISITGLNYTPANPDSLRGWNLVGNPYPSVLDFEEIDLTGVSAVAGASVWPHAGTSTSSYLNYSQGGGGNPEARYIQPGQGFMFQLTADNQTLSFTNGARTHDGLALFDKSDWKISNTEESLKITINGISTTYDETYISFREGATLSFDSYYDIHKLFGAIANPHVFSYINIEENEKVAIQSIPQPADGDAIHLGTRIGVSADYQMVFSGINTFAYDQAFILLDKKTNESYKIIQDSTYSFYMDVNDESNRFDLLFKMTTGVEEIDSGSDLMAYMNNGRLYINHLEGIDENAQISIYNTLGQKLMEDKIQNTYRGLSLDIPSAYYMIEVRTGNELLVKKFFVP